MNEAAIKLGEIIKADLLASAEDLKSADAALIAAGNVLKAMLVQAGSQPGALGGEQIGLMRKTMN